MKVAGPGPEAEARRYLELTSPDHGYIYGDFEVCPLDPEVPGRMRAVCVASGRHLVVENLADPTQRFRLLSTWERQRERR